MNKCVSGLGRGRRWHLLSADQTAALKHAELISIVAPQARFYCRLSGHNVSERVPRAKDTGERQSPNIEVRGGGD